MSNQSFFYVQDKTEVKSLKHILNITFDSNYKSEMTNGRERLRENLCVLQLLRLPIITNKAVTVTGML